MTDTPNQSGAIISDLVNSLEDMVISTLGTKDPEDMPSAFLLFLLPATNSDADGWVLAAGTKDYSESTNTIDVENDLCRDVFRRLVSMVGFDRLSEWIQQDFVSSRSIDPLTPVETFDGKTEEGSSYPGIPAYHLLVRDLAAMTNDETDFRGAYLILDYGPDEETAHFAYVPDDVPFTEDSMSSYEHALIGRNLHERIIVATEQEDQK